MRKSCFQLLVAAGVLCSGFRGQVCAGADGLTAVAAEAQVDARRLAEIAPQMQALVDQKQISGAVTLVACRGGAFGTQGWVDPQRQMIFVLMIQRTGFGNGDASDIRRTLQELGVKAVGG